MEIKARNFTIDFLGLPTRYGSFSQRYTTKIPNATMLIGAKYPVIEMSGPMQNVKNRGTILLINALVVEKDTIISDRIDWMPA